MNDLQALDLSIIVPCFNCESTVDEAVNSIFCQSLSVNFEVIMVDDGSSDSTYSILKKLKQRHNNIHIYQNDRNRGGGYTRNRAVSKSSGNLIFCLDSDDVLPPFMLQKMIDFLKKKEADGVIFSEARYFKNYSRAYNSVKSTFKVEKRVVFKDLFDEYRSSLTQVNFLYTKKSFERAGGYPEHHAFDTQGFGFKFLAADNIVYMCPDSYYYHRQGYKKSYFERIYENGEFSRNIYLILEDVLFKFSNKTIESLIKYNIFKNSNLFKENLISLLKIDLKKNDRDFFTDKYSSWSEVSLREGLNSENFLTSIKYYKYGQFEKSLSLQMKIIKTGFVSPVLLYTINRNIIGVSSAFETNSYDNITVEFFNKMTMVKQKSYVSEGLLLKIAHKLFLSLGF